MDLNPELSSLVGVHVLGSGGLYHTGWGGALSYWVEGLCLTVRVTQLWWRVELSFQLLSQSSRLCQFPFQGIIRWLITFCQNPFCTNVTENGEISPQCHKTTCGHWGVTPTSNHGQTMAEKIQSQTSIAPPTRCCFFRASIADCGGYISRNLEDLVFPFSCHKDIYL